MNFNLEQVQIPVASLGEVEDPEDLEAWYTMLADRIGTMRLAMPCRELVTVSQDVAERMFGETLPFIDPADPQPLLQDLGPDRHRIRIVLGRELPANTLRLA